jgi:Synergist-CTERM protein sorting domain-containing protein
MQSTDGQFYNAPFTPGYAPPAGTTLIMPPVQPGQTVSLLGTVDVDPQAPVGDTIQFMCTSNPNLGLPYLMFDPVLNFAPSITWNGHLIGGLFSEEQTVDAPQPPSFTPATAPDATVGVPYDLAFKVIGGQAPFNWSLFSGTLPPGLSLVPAATSDEMHLSGTPAAAGTYSFEVHLVDDGGYNVTNSYTLLVNTAPAGPGDQVTTGKPTGGGCAAAGGAAWPVLLALLLPLAVLRRRRRA